MSSSVRTGDQEPRRSATPARSDGADAQRPVLEVQDLDRDEASDVGVPGPPDRARTPAPEELEELVPADGVTAAGGAPMLHGVTDPADVLEHVREDGPRPGASDSSSADASARRSASRSETRPRSRRPLRPPASGRRRDLLRLPRSSLELRLQRESPVDPAQAVEGDALLLGNSAGPGVHHRAGTLDGARRGRRGPA